MSVGPLPSAGERPTAWEVRRLGPDDLAMIAMLDRSEHVDVVYTVVEGALTERPVTMAEVPPWSPTGTGPHSVGRHIELLRPLLADGTVLFGILDGAQPAGLAAVDPTFEPGMAWLAWLHVTRTHRRRGVASALWDRAAGAAREHHARSLYVSATPTGSAVGFYLSRGCRLADRPHPALLAKEPDDIHLVCTLA